MQRKLSFLLALLAIILFGVNGANAATEVTIPTASGTYINWGNADLTKCKTEHNGASVGSTHAGTIITFNIKNTVRQDYVMSFLTGASGLTAELGVTLSDDARTYLDATANVENTKSWTPSTLQAFVIKDLPVGNFTLTIKVNSTTGGYAGNYGNLAFTPLTSYDQIPEPGTIDINKGAYKGARVENSTNVGYVTNDCSATYTFYNNATGAYTLNMEIARYNKGGNLNIVIKDLATGAVDVNQDYTIAADAPGSYTDTPIQLDGTISEGLKSMTFTFTKGNSFICNFKNIRMSYAGASASVTGVTIDGQEIVEGTSSDWLCQLPIDYTAATTTLNVAAENGTVALTAVDEDGNAVDVTANADGTFTLPTPAASKTTTVTIALTANEGATAAKSTYTLKLFHLGEVSIKAITVGGVDETATLLDALNSDAHKAALSDKVFTTVPAVSATLVDGSEVSAEGVLEGTTATYNFTGKIGGKSKDYSLAVEGIHVYIPTPDDKTVDLKYTSAGKHGDGAWSDGSYTLTTTKLDGWNNSSFKLNGSDYTLTIPANIVVKQIVFKDFKSNYDAAADAGITSVASDGATVYIPSKHGYAKEESTKYDLIVNIEAHTAGSPITFSIKGGGQPTAWLQLITEEATDVKVATVTIKEGLQRTSFSSASAIDFSKTAGLKAYVITSADGNGAKVTEVTNVPANTGVIVEGEAGTYDLYSGSDEALGTDNRLVAAVDGYTVASGESVYGYGKKDGKEGFWLYAEGRKVSAGKAYLRISEAAGSKEFISFGDDTATGINTINAASDANVNAPAYNIAGQRVGSNFRGLVIKNGKKTIQVK